MTAYLLGMAEQERMKVLTDAQWDQLAPLIEACRPHGKTKPQDLRRTIEAIILGFPPGGGGFAKEPPNSRRRQWQTNASGGGSRRSSRRKRSSGCWTGAACRRWQPNSG